MDARTEEIVKRFSRSWEETEAFYEDLTTNYQGWDFIIPIKKYVSKLRKNGEDKFFRLGTSMHVLMISRSIEFGLRTEQKYIRIEAVNKNDFEIQMRDGGKIYREYRITDLQDMRLAKLLTTLKSTLVD